MAAPLISQGTLNRLLASVQWSDFPALNVIPAFLGKEGITLEFQGESTVYIDTMTGAVTSPEPYLRFMMRLHLLKSQPLSAAYKAQMELNTLIGDGIVRPDVQAGKGLTPYALTNCAIQIAMPGAFNGQVPDYPVTIGGYYIINNQLWGSG